MKYLGSKARFVNDILPIMIVSMQPGQCFVDAFCGGCSVIQHVPKEYRRIANDNNRYLVAMWEKLTMTDWKPPMTIGKPYYDQVRASYHAKDGKYDNATIGWVGFMASRNGRFYDGGYSGHNAKGRDYINENIRNIEKQIDDLRGVEWQTGSYDKVCVPEGSLIYYDPPYKGTTTYSTSKNFNHDAFYDWCRQMKRDGHLVFISEYNMPGDFVCVWQKTVTNSMNTTKTYRPTERLWRV